MREGVLGDFIDEVQGGEEGDAGAGETEAENDGEDADAERNEPAGDSAGEGGDALGDGGLGEEEVMSIALEAEEDAATDEEDCGGDAK
jgi:hypothetical protein